MLLTELELDVISTKAMQFSEKESIEYLKSKKHKISIRKYYRVLSNISDGVRHRAFEIGKNFLEDHMNTIHELQNIKKLMYRSYFKEEDELKKVVILTKITETMIPYISAYKEATKRIIEKVKKEIDSKEENHNISRD